jgi:hypothetical protein
MVCPSPGFFVSPFPAWEGAGASPPVVSFAAPPVFPSAAPPVPLQAASEAAIVSASIKLIAFFIVNYPFLSYKIHFISISYMRISL